MNDVYFTNTRNCTLDKLFIVILILGIFQGLIAVRLSNGTDVYLNTLNGHQALNVAGK